MIVVEGIVNWYAKIALCFAYGPNRLDGDWDLFVDLILNPLDLIGKTNIHIHFVASTVQPYVGAYKLIVPSSVREWNFKLELESFESH